MTAAACAEGPRRPVTFADLPPHQQEELVRLALVTAASTAYFVTLVILSTPLPSRNLAAGAALPDLTAPRPVIIETRLDLPDTAIAPARSRALRARSIVAVADLHEPVAATPAVGSSPRRNPFSRFFRGVVRAVTPD